MLAEIVLQTALAFLSREVPRWEQENHCYSCHNNGDAARALYQARARGFTIPEPALADTTAFLRMPGKWDEIHGAAAASDRKLARVQFAAALAEAVRSGAVTDRSALTAAAASLAAMQNSDGSWSIDTGGLPGAPATYGTTLATYLSRQTLQTAGASSYPAQIARATAWLSTQRPGSNLDAAALLLADPARRDCRDMLHNSQTTDGAWGPQARMPAEVFDTAVAILALGSGDPATPRARAWLIAAQEKDGGWPETTRPSGSQSYAERISTSAWAIYALLR